MEIGLLKVLFMGWIANNTEQGWKIDTGDIHAYKVKVTSRDWTDLKVINVPLIISSMIMANRL